MDDVKNCSKCKIEKFMINIHKNILTIDGVNSICKGCMKNYYLNNSITLIQNQKVLYLKNQNRTKPYKKNREKINEYIKKYKTKKTNR